MLVDFENSQLGEWFAFQNSHLSTTSGEPVFDDPDESVKFLMRSMTPFFEERVSVRLRKTEHVINPKTRQMERITYFEELTPDAARAERDDAFDYAIVDFHGLKDAKTGKDIPCNRETKLALMKIPIFDRFFARCQQLIGMSAVKRDEELEKNLSIGSSFAKQNLDQ